MAGLFVLPFAPFLSISSPLTTDAPLPRSAAILQVAFPFLLLYAAVARSPSPASPPRRQARCAAILPPPHRGQAEEEERRPWARRGGGRHHRAPPGQGLLPLLWVARRLCRRQEGAAAAAMHPGAQGIPGVVPSMEGCFLRADTISSGGGRADADSAPPPTASPQTASSPTMAKRRPAWSTAAPSSALT